MEYPKILLYQQIEQINPNMLQVVNTGAYYPPVATTGAYFLKMAKLELENHKS